MKIKLTTLSPVCIGNGGKINSISDYIFDWKSKQIHYINKDVVAEALAHNDDLMDEYVNGILYGMDNNRTLFSLKDFLENKLKLVPEEYTAYSVKANIKSAKELNTIIKNADGRPYIPGSTIKGALKNALVYELLSKDKNLLKDFAQQINVYYSQFEREVKHSTVPLKKLKIDKLKSVKEFNKEIQNLEKKINEYFLHIEYKDQRLEIPKMNFSISDSEGIAKECTNVIDIKKVHLKSKDGIPQVWEALKPSTSTVFDLKTNEKELNLEYLFKCVNDFSYNNIVTDLEMLDYHTSKSDDNNLLIDKYEEIQEMIDNLTSKECILRIGFNKGFYFNSIADLIMQESAEVFHKMLVLLDYKNYNENLDSGVLFPLTRGMASSETSLGWVKLEMV